MTDPVLLETRDGIATVTLNRPEGMNSLDTATKVALRDTLQAVAADEAARCVVLTGTGRAFCVGQDLNEHVALLESGDPAPLNTVHEHYNPIVTALVTMPKPVIARVQGVAAGAGASLTFACDFRIMADTAAYNMAFSAIALSCDTGISWTLPRLVGKAKALDLLYFPRTLKAAEALETGLVTKVVPADELDAEVDTLAGRLASGPTVAYGAIRRSLATSAGAPFEEGVAFEAQMMALTGGTADHRAAVDAFLAKEKPVFEGR